MPLLEQRNISVVWDLSSADYEGDSLVDDFGRKWSPSYNTNEMTRGIPFELDPPTPDFSNQQDQAVTEPQDPNTKTSPTLDQILKYARNTPSGYYHVFCQPPFNRLSTVREILGQFNDAISVEISYRDTGDDPSGSCLSMEGIEEFQALENIQLTFQNNGPRMKVSLEGIEFCQRLRHIACRSMDINSLAPLAHLELERLDITHNSVKDLEMVRAKCLKIGVSQLPLLEKAIEAPHFGIQTVRVVPSRTRDNVHEPEDPLLDDNRSEDTIFFHEEYPISWDLVILLEELQMKLNARLDAEHSNKPMASRQDLINGFNYGQVFLEPAWSDRVHSIADLKSVIVSCIKSQLGENGLESNVNVIKTNEVPIFEEEPPPEIAEIIQRISRRRLDINELKIRELMMIWRFFGFDDEQLLY